MEFSTIKMINEKYETQISELKKLIQALSRDKDAKEDLIKMEKEVISTFVKQVEMKEKLRNDINQELKKLKEFVKVHRHDKAKIMNFSQ